MLSGKFKGKTVEEAKTLTRDLLKERNEGCVYYEPEGLCVSRTGDICVVALCD